MKEGFSDYWSSSQSYDASVMHGFPPHFHGEWFVKTQPNVPLHRIWGDLENNWTLDSVYLQCCPPPLTPHFGGQMWSATLWDILQILGKTVADKLALAGHEKAVNVSMPKFDKIADFINMADEEYYNGTHESELKQIFCDRRIQCFRHGNPHFANQNYVIDVFDVLIAVNVAFQNGTAVKSDLLCDYVDIDVTCDNTTDVFDVLRFVGVAFQNGDANVLICDPCAP